MYSVSVPWRRAATLLVFSCLTSEPWVWGSVSSRQWCCSACPGSPLRLSRWFCTQMTGHTGRETSTANRLASSRYYTHTHKHNWSIQDLSFPPALLICQPLHLFYWPFSYGVTSVTNYLSIQSNPSFISLPFFYTLSLPPPLLCPPVNADDSSSFFHTVWEPWTSWRKCHDDDTPMSKQGRWQPLNINPIQRIKQCIYLSSDRLT